MKHITILLPLGFLFFVGCTHVPKLIVKQELVDSWSPTIGSKDPYQPPYFSQYKKNNYNLYYLASKHESKEDTPTFKLIKDAFSKLNPRFVLIEGIPFEKGISPKKYVAWSKAHIVDGIYKGGEPSYVAQLADQLNIPFAGAEPTEQIVLNEVIKEGYTLDDLLGFYFVRQIPEYERTKSLNPNDLMNKYQEFISNCLDDLSMHGRVTMNFMEFKDWYRHKTGKTFDVRSIKSEDSAPNSDSSSYLNKLSVIVGKVRDYYILNRITDALTKFNSVLIVYGGSHLSVEKRALQEMLGEPIQISKTIP